MAVAHWKEIANTFFNTLPNRMTLGLSGTNEIIKDLRDRFIVAAALDRMPPNWDESTQQNMFYSSNQADKDTFMDFDIRLGAWALGQPIAFFEIYHEPLPPPPDIPTQPPTSHSSQRVEDSHILFKKLREIAGDLKVSEIMAEPGATGIETPFGMSRAQRTEIPYALLLELCDKISARLSKPE